MNIRDNMKQQLVDLSKHLKETSELDVHQLGSEWEARKKALLRDSIFLDTFIIPDVEVAPKLAELVIPERPASTEVVPEDSSTGPAFLVSNGSIKP